MTVYSYKEVMLLMKSQTEKTAKTSARTVLTYIIAVLLIPTALWFLRERPISADSVEELTTNARAREEKRSSFQFRISSALTPLSPEQLDARWQVLQSEMARDEDNESQIESVVAAARQQSVSQSAAPVFARRAYLKEQPVWVIGYSKQYRPQTIDSAPSAADLKEYRYYQIVVFASQAPYAMLYQYEHNKPFDSF